MMVVMNTMKLYRHGALSAAEYGGELALVSRDMDAVKPAGRAGRCGSLYATVSLESVVRWVRANLMCYGSSMAVVDAFELTVAADDLWAYPLREWEDFSIAWGRSPWRGERYWEVVS